MMKRKDMLLALALCVLPALSAAATGSWVASQSAALRVALSDRESRSAPLAPPANIAPGARIKSVSWRFKLPPGEQISARLCHPQACIPAMGQRGYSEALANLRADKPLEFRFRLQQTGRPVRVTGLQIIVNYHR
ncbi:MAG TPA: flagellar protein FlhE [Halomonas sp.]|nr:flagellar protein FlhE [Halomonas sp.]